MLLLAQFRETRARPLILKYIARTADWMDELLGESIFSEAPRIIAAVFDGNLDALKKIVDDPDIDPMAAVAVISTSGLLARKGAAPVAEIRAWYTEIAKKWKSRFEGVLSQVAIEAALLGFTELEAPLLRLIDHGRIPKDLLPRAELERLYRGEDHGDNVEAHPSVDAIIHLRPWIDPDSVFAEADDDPPVQHPRIPDGHAACDECGQVHPLTPYHDQPSAAPRP